MGTGSEHRRAVHPLHAGTAHGAVGDECHVGTTRNEGMRVPMLGLVLQLVRVLVRVWVWVLASPSSHAASPATGAGTSVAM